MVKLFFTSSALLLLLQTELIAAPCATPVRWVNGQTVDSYWRVRPGGYCRVDFRSSGPTERTTIVARPSNGTATVGSGGTVMYRARAGFVGSDSFTYARQGRDARNVPMDARIRVQVTVGR